MCVPDWERGHRQICTVCHTFYLHLLCWEHRFYCPRSQSCSQGRRSVLGQSLFDELWSHDFHSDPGAGWVMHFSWTGSSQGRLHGQERSRTKGSSCCLIKCLLLPSLALYVHISVTVWSNHIFTASIHINTITLSIHTSEVSDAS